MSKFLKHTIIDGETLESIAYKYLGDASRNLEIAILNDLDYPFIIGFNETALRSGVKTAGDTLLLPIEVDDKHDLKAVSEDLDSVVFGSDIYLKDDDTRLSFRGGGELQVNTYKDLQTVSGADCLVQDLIHRLVTEEGTLPYHPTYGSRFLYLIGNKNDTDWRQKAIIEVSRTFKCDPRVVDVINVTLSRVTTGIAIECTVVTESSSFTLKEMIQEV